ncbi:CHAP domain-containing protein [Mycolicibacterium sp. S3B2]|uniref:CHAP domain-containing protein n=1 Tax=Mycolicibacterium sp. S3B2 TaxID=3415120 RepID=UPI003C7A5665
MTISLEQFKNNTLGQSVGKPRLDWPGDAYYVGECVSYVRQYIEQVHGIKSENAGHAVGFWSSPFMLRHYDRITNGSRKDGDILVWGDDPGNWTGKEGHIGISYGGRILNQNFGGSRKVTINDFFSQGYLGALRLKGKGGKTVIENNDPEYDRWSRLHLNLRGSKFGRDYFNKNIVGMTERTFIDSVMNNPETDYRRFAADIGTTAMKEGWSKTASRPTDGPTQEQIDAVIKEAQEALDAAKKLGTSKEVI